MKYKCPNCDQILTEDDIVAGICPKCKKIIDYPSVKKIEESFTTPSGEKRLFKENQKIIIEEPKTRNPNIFLSVLIFFLIGVILSKIFIPKPYFPSPTDKKTETEHTIEKYKGWPPEIKEVCEATDWSPLTVSEMYDMWHALNVIMPDVVGNSFQKYIRNLTQAGMGETEAYIITSKLYDLYNRFPDVLEDIRTGNEKEALDILIVSGYTVSEGLRIIQETKRILGIIRQK